MSISKNFMHKHNDSYLDAKIMKNLLWYSITKQSYIQRNNLYDASILLKTDINDFMLIYIKSLFQIRNIEIVDEISFDDIVNKNNCVVFKKKNTSIVVRFIEGIRNGIAHGGYIANKKFVKFISQDKSYENSPINFYANFKIGNFKTAILNYLSEFNDCYNDLKEIRYVCLRKALKISKIKNKYYSKYLKKYIKFVEFHSKKDITKQYLLNSIAEYKNNDKILLVVNMKTGNINLDKLFNEYNDVKVRYVDDFIEYINALIKY